jgi:glycosyltransferase involved in cell wall biosynthesis
MNQKVSVILPVYNESEFIGEIFEKVRQFSLKNPEFNFIFVDDGSKDSTKKIILGLVKTSARIRLVSCPENKGKGYAIRKGVENSSGGKICFTDGDLAYSLDYLKIFSERLKESDVVIGWRAPFSENLENTKSIRKLAGKVFNFFSRIFLDLDFPDMQAGIKGFRKEAAEYLFSKQKINRWSFDTEVIFLAKRKKYSISQVPVKVSESNLKIKSQVHLVRDSLKMFASLLKIRFNHLLGKYE